MSINHQVKVSPRVELIRLMYRPEGRLTSQKLYFDKLGDMVVIYASENRKFLCRFLEDDMYWYEVIDKRRLLTRIIDHLKGYKL